MIRRSSTLRASIGLSIWAASVGAQAADNDVRCLATSKLFAATEKDPMRKQLAVASAFYYLGRLEARLLPAELKAQLAEPSALVKQADAGALMTACAKRVQGSQRSLMAIGQALGSPRSKK